MRCIKERVTENTDYPQKCHVRPIDPPLSNVSSQNSSEDL